VKKDSKRNGIICSMNNERDIITLPLRIVRHFPLYLNWIREKMAEGTEYVSAAELAAACGFDPVVTRKELAITGVIGTPRKGFPAAELARAITVCLGWDNSTDAVLVGAGSLGTALLGYDGFREHNFDFVVAFDTNPEKIGSTLHGVPVRNVTEMAMLVKRMNIRLAVLTVPKIHAQACADILIEAGIRGIWNFSPVKLVVPKNVHVENADLAAGLAALSHSIRD
jgi:redox-sensing transcriptional repressor